MLRFVVFFSPGKRAKDIDAPSLLSAAPYAFHLKLKSLNFSIPQTHPRLVLGFRV